MKKLLLTSDGLTSRKIQKEFLKLLDKPPAENKVLIMHTAKLRRHLSYIKKARKSLTSLGIKKENINEVNINKKVNTKKFKNIDVFYSFGGNTFYILDRVRKTEFDMWIKNFVKRGGVYIGLSAGSIIVHKTIEIAGWGKEADLNLIGLRDLRGLNLTNVAIFPHFKNKLRKEIAIFKKNTPYPIIELKDGQALEIIGNKKKIVR